MSRGPVPEGPRFRAPLVLSRRRFAGASVAVAMVASACSGAGDQGARTSGPGAEEPVDRLRIAVTQDRGPVNIFSGVDDWLSELVYDKLLAPSPYVADPGPWLAEEVRQVDPSTWDARIRQGVRWHDGMPFTPEDVKFTYEYFKGSASVTNRYTHHVNNVPDIAEIDVVDPSTVRFRCGYPCPDLGPITLADLVIIPRHVWEGEAKPREVTALPVGTGPYKLTSHSPTAGYRFEANTNYFAGAPLVRELVMPVIGDPSAAFTALRTGEIDAAARPVPPELLEEFTGQDGLRVATTKPLQFTEMRLNFRRPPFDSGEFRRAISLALDRQDLLRTVVLGQGRPSDRGYPHPDSPWTNPRLSTPTDPAEGRRVLDGLGFVDRDRDGVRERAEGGALSFSIKVNGAEPTHVRAAELMTEHLRAVGILVSVVALDAGGMTQLGTSRDFDMTVSNIGPHGVADPTQFIMSHRSGYLWQSPMLVYPEWDGLFERWKATTTVEDRTAVMFQMQELFNRKPTSIPLYYADEHWAFRPGPFDGWVESPGLGIVHKWSFLPRSVSAAAKAFTTEFRAPR